MFTWGTQEGSSNKLRLSYFFFFGILLTLKQDTNAPDSLLICHRVPITRTSVSINCCVP